MNILDCVFCMNPCYYMLIYVGAYPNNLHSHQIPNVVRVSPFLPRRAKKCWLLLLLLTIHGGVLQHLTN